MYQVISFERAAARRNTDFFSLAPTPHDEQCTPAGADTNLGILECTALINQLLREQGAPPEKAEFFIVRNEGHDFGSYYEAGIFYSEQMDEDEETPSCIYAQNIETNIPENWDDLAKQELREKGHPLFQLAKVVRMKAA